MTSPETIDLADRQREQIMKNPEKYSGLIMKAFGYYLLNGAAEDDDGETMDSIPFDWRQAPEMFALSAPEQDFIYEGVLQLMNWDDAPAVMKQMLTAWFQEGAPS